MPETPPWRFEIRGWQSRWAVGAVPARGLGGLMTKWIRIIAAPTGYKRRAMHGVRLAVMLTALPGAAIASDKIVLQLHREPQFEFAGYYAALWNGFYREAGLEVEIKPGAPLGAAPVDAVREVIERRARFGTGTAQLLISAAQGATLLLLAPIFQQSGAAVYYRSDGNFGSPQALRNATIGRLPPSNILDAEFRAVMHGEGIDADKLKSVSIEPRQALAAVADRRVDAVVGSAWELPWQAREKSVALKSFSLDDYRPLFYGDGLFTLQRSANADPTTAQRFREASIKGWEYALQHPDEIAARISAEPPAQASVADPAAFARYQSEVARRLTRFPDVPLGHSTQERWSEAQQGLLAAGAMSRPAELDAFLYEPRGATWDFASRLALVTVSATIVFAFLFAVQRFWRKTLRSKPRTAQAFTFAELCKRIALPLDRSLFALVRPRLAQTRATAHETFGRMRQIVRQLAQSTEGGRPSIPTVDLNASLTALEGSIQRRLPGTINCRLSLLPELLLASADPDVLTAMILDLAAEAASDMLEGGELVVGARQYTIDRALAAEFPGSSPGDYVRITVKDGGRGLSPERLERVFYPETTTRPAAAAAWQLMRRIGGFAAVESAEGIGAAVHLYFCRAVGIAESASPPAADDVHALAAE